MNEENLNSNNNTNSDNKTEIVDANLLNPFQANANNNSNSETTNVLEINNSQIDNMGINSDSNINGGVHVQVQDNSNSFNSDNSDIVSSSVTEVNNNINPSTPGNDNVNVNNNQINNSSVDMTGNSINHSVQPSTSVQSVDSNISNTPVSIEKSSLLFLILAIVSIFGFFTNGILTIIGIVLCIISLIGSIIMLKKKAKLSGISVALSAIILIVYILSFVLAFQTVNKYVDQTKASIFKDYAISFSMGAKQNVLVNKKISCDEGSLKSTREPLPELANGGKISPFGGNFDYNSSYVLVEATEINGRCQYKASIYLTDGKYSIGVPSNPISENDINSASINNK